MDERDLENLSHVNWNSFYKIQFPSNFKALSGQRIFKDLLKKEDSSKLKPEKIHLKGGYLYEEKIFLKFSRPLC